MSQCVFHDTGQGQQDRKLFEIVERAYGRREKVLVFAQNAERAAAIDRLLWIMKQEAFIPHKILGDDDSECAVPVAIVTAETNPLGADTLIADGHCSLEYACGFGFVHEFVNRASLEIHEACRNRFRSYRARNVPTEHRKA